MSSSRFYNMRSCNDDYVGEPRMSRSAYIDYTNENIEYINKYPEANIKFRETVRDFTCIPDAKLEALDAHMEALYNRETITMELTLSEPEDNDRPDFDEDLEDDYDDNYEEYSLSDRFNDDDDDEYCSECNEKREIVAYGWRNANDNLCFICVNLPGMDDYEC